MLEYRREREFYSYYAPFLSMIGGVLPLCDLNDPESVAAHRPVSSPDKALTAFVQLVALRLQVRRSMLFFFDSDHAYVLAEATRSLSLHDEAQHALEDSLWLGVTQIPRGFSICEVTVDLPNNGGSNAQEQHSSSIVHIINNLTEDTRFCDRPYVKGGPMARFYAGVPITTPQGTNIGALCVLDDKPRDGLQVREIDFLRDMAAATMTHLEMLRAQWQNQRGRHMTDALGAFVEGQSQAQDWWLSSQYRKREKQVLEKTSTQSPCNAELRPASRVRTSRHVAIAPARPSKGDWSRIIDFEDFAPSADRRSSVSEAEHTQAQSVESVYFKTSSNVQDIADEPQECRLPTKIKSMTSRAAALICRGLDADEVVFLDLQNRFPNRLDKNNAPGEMNQCNIGATDINEQNTAPKVEKTRQDHPNYSSLPSDYCGLLGSAHRMLNADAEGDTSATHCSQEFLRGLLERSSRGRVWHFNPDGGSSPDDSGPGVVGSLYAELRHIRSTGADQYSSSEFKDQEVLREVLPGVRSLILVGMWDTEEQHWFGACLA